MMKLSDPKGGDGESRKLQHEAGANLAHARVKIEATADGTVGQGNDPAAVAATTVAELDLALPPCACQIQGAVRSTRFADATA